MGLGGYPATDRHFLGMLGMHGTYEANMAMQHCDVLLAIGARFDDRVIGNPKHFFEEPRTIIHIDIDPSSISKRVKVDVPIVGNVREVLEELPAPARSVQGAPGRRGAQGVVGADRAVAQPRLPEVRPREPDHQAAVRDPEALRGDRRRRLRHLRRRPAPDVGGAVLQVRPAAALDQLGRPGHDGLRPAGGDGRAARASRSAGRVRHGRGEHPDVHPGALDLQAVPPADQDREPEQQVHGHGAAVAGVLPRQPLRRVVHGRAAGFREARRVVRPRRHAHRASPRTSSPRSSRRSRARRTWCSWTSSPIRPRTCSRWCRAARGCRR